MLFQRERRLRHDFRDWRRGFLAKPDEKDLVVVVPVLNPGPENTASVFPVL